MKPLLVQPIANEESANKSSVPSPPVSWNRSSSPTAPGVTRKWNRLQDYRTEVSNARVYAGFHYRFSTEVGTEMGRKIGELAVATQLRGVEAMADPMR
jgi:hypothetical protein